MKGLLIDQKWMGVEEMTNEQENELIDILDHIDNVWNAIENLAFANDLTMQWQTELNSMYSHIEGWIENNE
jgi:hypothetical protein